MQKSLFKPKLNEKECINYLTSLGYKITKVKSSKTRTNNDLINFFYNSLNKVSKTNFFSYTVDYKVEHENLEKFQNKLLARGLPKVEVNNQIYFTLNIFFKYFDKLNLTTIPTLSFLLSPSGSWILKKALVLNKQATTEDLNFLLESVYNDEAGLEELREKGLKRLLTYRDRKLNGKKED